MLAFAILPKCSLHYVLLHYVLLAHFQEAMKRSVAPKQASRSLGMIGTEHLLALLMPLCGKGLTREP